MISQADRGTIATNDVRHQLHGSEVGQAAQGAGQGQSSTLPAASQEGEHQTRRLLVLLHGEKANDDLVRQAISRLRSEGHQITVRVTYEAGDVDRLVAEALKLGSADTLVAAGGDGTIQEVVAALLKHTGGLKDTREIGPAPPGPVEAHAQGLPPVLQKLSVGILPMGTSNDFAATTGIPEDPYEALKLATGSTSLKRLDVGLLNGQVFLNTASLGASADIGNMTSSRIKKILGPAAFLFTGARAVRSWVPVPSVLCFPYQPGPQNEQQEVVPGGAMDALVKAVEQDLPAQAAHVAVPEGGVPNPKYEEGGPLGDVADEPEGSGPALATAPAAAKSAASATGEPVGELEGVPLLHLSAANNRQVASMVALSPSALLDDGMLDCVYLVGDPGKHVKRLLWSLLSGGASRTRVVPHLLRVPWLEVATDSPVPWSLDGEAQPQPTSNFRFSLIHRAIQFHLPDDRVLVAGQAPPADEAEEAAGAGKKRRHRRLPKLRMGKLRPPTIADMVNGVVRFRKRKDWGRVVRGAVATTVKALALASLGAFAMHWWHTRRSRGQGEVAEKGGEAVAAGKEQTRGQRARRRRHTAVAA